MACQEYKIEQASAQELFNASFDVYYGHLIDARQLYNYVHGCEGDSKESIDEDDYITWVCCVVEQLFPGTELPPTTFEDFRQEFYEKHLPIARQYKMFDKFSVRMVPHDQTGKLQDMTRDEVEDKGKYLLVMGIKMSPEWLITRSVEDHKRVVQQYHTDSEHLPWFVKSTPGYLTIQKDCNCCDCKP